MPNEPIDFFNEWKQTPSKQNSAKLLESISPYIDRSLYAYGMHKDPQMKGFAKLYALDSLAQFDPKRGSIQTFLNHSLQRLQRVGGNQIRAVPVSERAVLEMGEIDRAEGDLLSTLGREPTVQELSDYVKLPDRRIRALKKRYKPQVYASAMDASPYSWADATEDNGESFRESLWAEAIYDSLAPVDQLIYDHSTGSHGAKILPKNIIAAKVKMSPAAVSQRAKKISQTLLESIDS